MIPKPIISPKEAVALVKAGDTIICSGFMGVGAAETLSKAMAEHCPHKDLTLLTSDHSWCTLDRSKVNGVGHMVEAKLFKKAKSTHIGLNQSTQEQLKAGTLEVELMPMGTYVERVRSGGSGLGGVLTPVGVGTEIEQGKQVIEIDGKKFLLELPLRANVAFVRAKKADRGGNLIYNKTARNFNPLVAMAADIVVAEVEEIVEIGELDPDTVHTPFVFVDYLVLTGGK